MAVPVLEVRPSLAYGMDHQPSWTTMDHQTSWTTMDHQTSWTTMDHQTSWTTTDLPFTTPQYLADMNDTYGGLPMCQSDMRLMDFSEFVYEYRKDTWIPITWREVLKIVAYLIVFLVSTSGNLLVILVVYYNAHMRTSTNTYLVNLAVADLLVTVGCVWVHIIRHLSYPNYILPAIVCKLEGFLQVTALLASVLTLTVISVGRFVAVMFPLHARTSPDRAHRVIAAVWLLALVLASPLAFFRELYNIKWKDFTSWHCGEFWPKESKFDPQLQTCVVTFDLKKQFYTLLTIALYFFPVSVMLLNYGLVVWRLWVTKLPGEHSAPARNTATRAKKRVVKMVSVVLLVFVLCWTPLQSIILYSNFLHQQQESGGLPEWFTVMEFSAYFVAYSNSALNPIIYCGFNANFRQGLVSLLTCRHSSSSRIYHRRHWKGMTAGTRETTVGCSGPEPAVLLEYNTLRRSRLVHRGIPPGEGERLMPASSRGSLLPDVPCKNCCQEANHQPVESHLALTHYGTTTTTTSFVLNNHLGTHKGDREGRKLEAKISASSSSASRAPGTSTPTCGCCRKKSHKTLRRNPRYDDDDDEVYDLRVLRGDVEAGTKGEML